MRHFQLSVLYHFLLRARIQTFWITKLVLVEFPVFWLTFPGKLCNFPARHKLQNIPEFANRKLAQLQNPFRLRGFLVEISCSDKL